MSTLFLHAGMHKTGTSSIQQSLAALPQGRGPQLVTLRSSNLSKARHAFGDPEEVASRKGWASADAIDVSGVRFRERLAQRLAETAERDVVVSGEGFNPVTTAGLARFLAMVPHDEVRVIVYVREPYGAASSKLQQRIKAGRLTAWEAPSLIPSYRHNAKFERLAHEFVPFDRARLHAGCVVRDFCARVEIEIHDDEVVTSNESLSSDAARLLYCRNLWLQREALPRSSATSCAHILAQLPGAKLRLSAAVIEDGLARRREQLDWMLPRMPEGWYRPHRDDEAEGDTVGSPADLARVPEPARAWLSAQRPDYDGSPDPLVIGAAVDGLVSSHRAAYAAKRPLRREERRARKREERKARLDERQTKT